MKKLHVLQEKILKLLKKHQDNPLTIRELQNLIGASSPSVVHHHIQQLEKKGYLRRNPNNPSDYQVIFDSPERKVTYLNLYGLATCGPKGSILDGMPIKKVPISTEMLGFSSSEAFMVKAKGNSMNPKIKENDLVVAKKSNTAESGDIVVCINDGEALIKKIKLSDKGPILISLNSDYEPFFASSYFKVEGIVRGVFSYLS